MTFINQIADWAHSLTFIPGCESVEDSITYYGESSVSMIWNGNPYTMPTLFLAAILCFGFLFLLAFFISILKFFRIIRPRERKGFFQTFKDNFFAMFHLRYAIWFVLTPAVLIYLYMVKGLIPLITNDPAYGYTQTDMYALIGLGFVILVLTIIVLRIAWAVSGGYREFVAENIRIWGWWGIIESILSPFYLIIWFIMILIVTGCAIFAFYPLFVVIMEYVACFLLIGFYTLTSCGGIDILVLFKWLVIFS